MNSFNNHSGSRGLPRFARGICWATGLSLATPFTEGCPGVNDKASPPGCHQEQAPEQRCTFRPTAFTLVNHAMPCQFSIRSWTRTLRRPGIRHRHLPCHATHNFFSETRQLHETNVGCSELPEMTHFQGVIGQMTTSFAPLAQLPPP